MTALDKKLVLKLADLEWLAFPIGKAFTTEELSILIDEGFSVDYYLDNDESIFAYILYEDDGTCLVINNLAVHPDYQNLGFGTALIDRIKSKLTSEHIGVYAPLIEDFLEIGEFLKKNQFEYISTTHPEDDPDFSYYNLFFENQNYEGEVHEE